MRIGILAVGITLVVAVYIISSSFASQKQMVHQTIGAVCNSFFGTTGPATSPTMLSGCQGYLSSKMLFYAVGGVLALLGILLPGKSSESTTVESRAGGMVWTEAGKVDKAIDKDALKALKLRYARGEITKEQYDQMREDLVEDSPHHNRDDRPY